MISHRIIVVCTVIVATAYLYGTTQIPSLQIGDPLGPKAFPYLVGIGLLVAAGWLLLETLSARKSAPTLPQSPETDNGDRRHLVVLGAVVVWTAIYFAAFQPLGFLLSTPVFLFVLMSYLNRGKWLVNGLTSVLFTVAVYALFSKVLGVSLAKGILSF